MTNDCQTPNPHRFFCPTLPKPRGSNDTTDRPEPAGGLDAHTDSPVSDPTCTLGRQESHHARKVLRLSVGDTIELFDGQGSLAQASIDRFDAGHALCRIHAFQHHPPITPSLTLASAVPKGPRADSMAAQLSQLGVDRFIPLQAEHSVATPSPAKLDRFAKSTVESAKQCRRLWLMQIDKPLAPADAWADETYDLKLIATPHADPLPDLADQLHGSQSVLVLIGPEGGFSPAEQTAATDAGCLNWSFAPNTLRIETAATAAAAILHYPGLY